MNAFDCDQVLEQLRDYLDEEAKADLCDAIEQHLLRCKDCKVYVDTVKKTIVLYQADRKLELPMTAARKLGAAMAQEYGGPRA